MFRKCHINRLSMVMVIIFAVFLSFYAADAAAFEAVPLTDIEMEEISGGFNGGDFLYFGIDYSIFGNVATNNNGSLGGGTVGLPTTTTLAYKNVVGNINASVIDNIGITSVNFALGNDITQNITTIFNISLATFHVNSTDQIKPILSHWINWGAF